MSITSLDSNSLLSDILNALEQQKQNAAIQSEQKAITARTNFEAMYLAAMSLAQSNTAAQENDTVTNNAEGDTSTTSVAPLQADPLLSTALQEQWKQMIVNMNADNMENLSDKLASQLNSLFNRNDISFEPPVQLKVVDGEIVAEGERDDLEEINKILNNKEIKKAVELLTQLSESMSMVANTVSSGGVSSVSNPWTQYAGLMESLRNSEASTTFSFNGELSINQSGKEIKASDFRTAPTSTIQ